MTTTTTTLDTPVGRLGLVASETGLSRCTFRTVRPGPAASPAAHRWLDLARRELDAYFTGRLRVFTVPVDLRHVGALHRRVLGALANVGYGETTTYGRLAGDIGLLEDGPCQVGGAMARNPVLIVVPCHRVLGAGGALVGYAGGLTAKQWLLDQEARDRAAQPTLPW